MHAKVVRYFVEVVRAGSIRKAAEQLHVVPTAVNRQILNLEEELGAPLFERIHNTLKLTPVGEIVLAHARSTLRDFDAVRQRIEEVRGLREGEASLATMAGLAGAFRRSAISVAPVIETTSTALMRRLVVQGVGITLLNRLDIDEERRAGSLVFVPLRDAGLSPQTLRLVMRAGGEPEPAATLLAGLVIRCLDDLLAP